jgi:CBS domain-containing membrane protein
MGASAVLLFAVPSSPLAQPWSIIGGNLCAALHRCELRQAGPGAGPGGGAGHCAGHRRMFLLRCIHPPSGAVA